MLIDDKWEKYLWKHAQILQEESLQLKILNFNKEDKDF